MSASSLARLATIADRRTTREAVELERVRADVALLERQRATLDSYAREYREGLVGSMTTPDLLQRRQAFVTRLEGQIMTLDERIERCREQCDAQERTWRFGRAGSSALHAMQARATDEERRTASRRDRLDLDVMQSISLRRARDGDAEGFGPGAGVHG